MMQPDLMAELESQTDTRFTAAEWAAAHAAVGIEPTPTHSVGADFLTAGRAVFTVSNPKGERYTYRLGASDDGAVLFAALLTGPDNGSDFTYLGLVNPDLSGGVRLTRKSRFAADSKPVRVLAWALGLVRAGRELPAGYTIHHAGRCGRCGRRLTVPSSIETGLGPECAMKVAA